MNIKSHLKFNNGEGSLIHTVLLDSENKPVVRDVAIRVGYHPHGYGLDEIHCNETGAGSFEVKWESALYC